MVNNHNYVLNETKRHERAIKEKLYKAYVKMAMVDMEVIGSLAKEKKPKKIKRQDQLAVFTRVVQ